MKDADCYFDAEIIRGNSISVFPIEEMSLIDPQHKSYVADDNMRYVTNIIEQRVIGHLFNSGGYGFEDVNQLMYTIEHYLGADLKLSHVVYSMLLKSVRFSLVKADNYRDFGIR